MLILILFFPPSYGYSQKIVRKLNKGGNAFFKKEQYSKAEIEYRKALDLALENPLLKYNLANTLYRTNRIEEATQLYAQVLPSADLPSQLRTSNAHNLGNACMSAKQYEKAVEAYKVALRNNPTDEETRYNLALAQKLLQKQQNEKNQNQQNQQQDKKDQQQNKDKDKEQDKEDQQQDKPNKTQEKPQDKEERMSKDNAEKILDAFLKDERNTQEKVEKAKQKHTQNRSNTKNW